MGLYPSRETGMVSRFPGGSETWVEQVNRFDGVIRYRRVYAGPWMEGERTNCYCCSCGEREGSDMACRNHGTGHAERACEAHGMPGSAWDFGDDDPSNGIMPASVQEYRRMKEDK